MSEPQREPTGQLPAVSGSSPETQGRARRLPPSDKAAAFDAQLLGQGGARRGLRGGPPVLEEAQQAYLETEWSGPSDRRAPAGRARREKI